MIGSTIEMVLLTVCSILFIQAQELQRTVIASESFPPPSGQENGDSRMASGTDIENIVLQTFSMMVEDIEEDKYKRHARLAQYFEVNKISTDQLKTCILDLCFRTRQFSNAIFLYEFLLDQTPASVVGDVHLFNAIGLLSESTATITALASVTGINLPSSANCL